VALFGVAIWVRSEEGLEDWIITLDLYEFYAGIYILIFGGAVIMITALLGCFSALTERTGALQVVSMVPDQVPTITTYRDPLKNRLCGSRLKITKGWLLLISTVIAQT